jgi:hypothetical protein
MTTENPSLGEFLSTRARHASDRRLAVDVGAGFIVLLLTLIWRGSGWPILASASTCFLAFGAWGICDRELNDPTQAPSGRQRVLRIGRDLAMVVGVGAAVALALTTFAVVLGPIKS